MTTDPIAAARALIAEADNPRVHGLLMTARDLRDMVATLADALEAERAKVAAAYEAAADAAFKAPAPEIEPEAEWLMEHQRENSYNSIRALTPADAQAALDKLLEEARAEGWRAGRDAAAGAAERRASLAYSRRQVLMPQTIPNAIRALPEPKETSHE